MGIRMNLKVKKIITGLMICFLFVGLKHINAMAGTVNISAGSVETSEGETINVPITLTADAVMGVAEVYISYDSALLEYNGGEGAGGAGLIKYVFYEMDETGKGKSFNISFTAKKAGTSAINIDSNTRVLEYTDGEVYMEVAAAPGQVAISAPTTASSDCNLSGLTISAVKSSGESVNVDFIPAFSPDVLEYKADLTEDIERLVVSTTLSDQNATTQVSGTRIDPGDNKTTITVVAEDGSQKVYTLYTTRAVAVTTAPEETTTSDENGETTPVESTAPEIDRSPIYIETLGKYIIQDFNLITPPEGFEESTTTYNGNTIASFRGISKPLALLCLADDTEGTNPVFYIYNEIDSSMSKMINLTATPKIYTIIPTGEDYAGPEGYIATTIEINGDTISAWIKEEGSDFYVVYAMNYNGETALYVYDKTEQTMQRFVEGNKGSDEVENPSVDESAIKALQNKYTNLEKQYESDKSDKTKIIIGLGIACFVLLLICIILLFKANIIKEDEEEGEETDEENKILGADSNQELKLDMVAQVNEMKAERLAENVNEVLEEQDTSSGETDSQEAGNADAVQPEQEPLKQPEPKEQEKSVDNGTMTETAGSGKTKEIKEDAEKIIEGLDKSADSEYVINMEEDEPFEIEFVDLEDGDDR